MRANVIRKQSNGVYMMNPKCMIKGDESKRQLLVNYYVDSILDEDEFDAVVEGEIDIDDDTLIKYNTETGELGAKLQKSIALEPRAHFILGNDERCPFLNDKNLCELILLGGEEMLCQICKDKR